MLDQVSQNDLLISLETEASEILPLVEKGVVGKSEKYRIERELAALKSKLLSISAQIKQNQKALEQVSLEEKSFLQK